MNIVIINNFARFPGTPRWDFELVRYEDFICHETNQVSYIANQRGLSAITADAGSYRLYELNDLSDVAAYHPVLEEIIREHGPVDKLIAFSEFLLDVAAELRAAFSIPGILPAENRLGRDKLLMKRNVSARGLRVPRFMSIAAGQQQDAVAFAKVIGYPLILKPVDGAASVGVKVIDSEVLLRTEIDKLPAGCWDLEEFIDGDLLHVDGLIDADGRVIFIVPSRYINSCLDFTHGAPLGAVMLEPGTALYEKICGFSVRCLEALEIKACPFHLELFHTPDGNLVFLEVAARVAGADVPYMIHKNTGINLFREWIDLIMQRTTQFKYQQDGVGGWLMFPRPSHLPSRVDAVTGFDGKVQSLYRQLIPAVGEVVKDDGGYCSMQSGRFLFSAISATEVAADMETVIRDFSIEASLI